MALCKYNRQEQLVLRVLQEQPSDQVLMEVARKSVCSELELGIELEIEHHDIVNSLPCNENCSRGERKIELLLLWKRLKGHDATNYMLLFALHKRGDKPLLQFVTYQILVENGITERSYITIVLTEVCRSSLLEYDGRDNDTLRSENAELKSENSALKIENNDLKNENKELKRRCSMLDKREDDYLVVQQHYDDTKDGHTILTQETPPLVPSCDTCHQNTDQSLDHSFKTLVTYDASANLYLSPRSSYSDNASPIVISDTEVDMVPEVIELSPNDITDNDDESIDCSQDSTCTIDNSSSKTPVLDENPSLEDWPEGALPIGSKRLFVYLDEDTQMGWVDSPKVRRNSYF